MSRSLLAVLTLAALAAAPATKPVGPPASAPPAASVPAAAVLPEPMLRSVPKEFAPKGPDDGDGRLNAQNWLERNYAGQTVTLIGEATKPVVKIGDRGVNIVKFDVVANRPTRWLSMPVKVKCPVEQSVSVEEAARLAKLGEGRPATVKFTFKQAGLHWWKPPKPEGSKKETEVGVEVILMGAVESYLLR